MRPMETDNCYMLHVIITPYRAGQYLNITNVSYSDGGPYVCTVQFKTTKVTVTVDVNVHGKSGIIMLDTRHAKF